MQGRELDLIDRIVQRYANGKLFLSTRSIRLYNIMKRAAMSDEPTVPARTQPKPATSNQDTVSTIALSHSRT